MRLERRRIVEERVGLEVEKLQGNFITVRKVHQRLNFKDEELLKIWEFEIMRSLKEDLGYSFTKTPMRFKIAPDSEGLFLIIRWILLYSSLRSRHSFMVFIDEFSFWSDEVRQYSWKPKGTSRPIYLPLKSISFSCIMSIGCHFWLTL